MNQQLISKIEKYVKGMMLKIQSHNKHFHGIDHTLDVVKISKEIAIAEGLSEDKLEIVLIAAWFHDTGYLFCSNGHEKQSSIYAREFLEKELYPEDKINSVVSCINATTVPQNPKNLLEEILCDADLHHLGLPDNEERGRLLRKELRDTGIKDFSDIEWYKMSYDFMSQHHYFTNYAKKNFNKQKVLNLRKMKRYIKKLETA